MASWHILLRYSTSALALWGSFQVEEPKDWEARLARVCEPAWGYTGGEKGGMCNDRDKRIPRTISA